MTEEGRLRCNLKDAGCDEATIQKYFQLYYEGKQQEQYRLLARHRASLLDQIHMSQHVIDCLDYLIYNMKKELIKNKNERYLL